MPNAPGKIFDFTSEARKRAGRECQPENPDDPYSQYVAGLTNKHNKRGRGLRNDIDNAPGHLGDLAAYFVSLKPERLASCWVACMVDAVDPEQAGNVARALLVVATRLHGVKFENPVTSPHPLRSPPMPTEAPARTPPPAWPQQINKATPIQPEVTLPGGYKLGAGEPPPEAEKPKGKNADLFMACAALPPGGWFIIDKPGKMTKAVILKRTDKLHVTAYHLADGRLVVKSTKKP